MHAPQHLQDLPVQQLGEINPPPVVEINAPLPEFREVVAQLAPDVPVVPEPVDGDEVNAPILDGETLYVPILYTIHGGTGLVLSAFKIAIELIYIVILWLIYLNIVQPNFVDNLWNFITWINAGFGQLDVNSDVRAPETNTFNIVLPNRTVDGFNYYTLYNNSDHNAFHQREVSAVMVRYLERKAPMIRPTEYTIPRLIALLAIETRFAFYTEPLAFYTASYYFQRMRWRTLESNCIRGNNTAHMLN